jgi:hypothetical protein
MINLDKSTNEPNGRIAVIFDSTHADAESTKIRQSTLKTPLLLTDITPKIIEGRSHQSPLK